MANNFSIQQIHEIVRDEVWTMLQEFLGMQLQIRLVNHPRKHKEADKCTSLKCEVHNLTQRRMSLEHEIQNLIYEWENLKLENAKFRLRNRSLPEVEEGDSSNPRI